MAKGKYQTAPAKTAGSPPQKKSVKQSPPKKGGKNKVFAVIGIAAAVVIIVAAVVAMLVANKIKNYDKIYPNVYVSGMDVSGLTESEAAALIASHSDEVYASAPLTVVIDHVSFELDSSVTGARLISEVAASEAYAVCRSESLVTRLLAYLGAGERVDVTAGFTVDEAAIRGKIDEHTSGVCAEKADFDYALDGSTLNITVGSDGVYLDTEALYEDIYQHLAQADFSPVEAKFDYYTAQPLDIDAIAAQLCVAPVDAYYDPETKTIVDAEDGYGFDPDEIRAAIASGIGGEKLSFPMEAIPPEKDAAAIQAEVFGDVLSEFTSNLVYNPKRTSNVKLASDRINGTILNPEDIFSFNGIVGERTVEGGFQDAPVYVNGETKGEIGGGICQVASTLYVTCLYADLEIVERINHQFLVDYVPRGLDATIYWGSSDYRFCNNTENPIKIDMIQEGQTLTVRLYGKKTNDNYVKMTSVILNTIPYEEVEQIDETKPTDYRHVEVTAYTGYTISVTRNVYDGDDNLISSAQESYNVYKKRDRLIIVGPPVTPPETDPGYEEPLPPEEDPWDVVYP